MNRASGKFGLISKVLTFPIKRKRERLGQQKD